MLANCGAKTVREFAVRNQSDSLKIVIYLEGACIEDTLRISFVHAYGENKDDLNYQKKMNENGVFEFVMVPKAINGYIKIEKKRKYALDSSPNMYDKIAPLYYWNFEDSVSLSIFLRQPTQNYDNALYRHYSYLVNGRGSKKYWLANQIDSIIGATSESGKPIFDGNFNYQEPHAVGMRIANNLIDKYKNSISDEDYYNLKLRVLSNNSRSKFHLMKNFYEQLKISEGNDKIIAFKTSLNNLESENVLNAAPSIYFAKSLEYISYTLRCLETYCSIIYDSNYAERLYELIKKKYSGRIRDYLIIAYFLQARFAIKSNDMYLDALTIVKDADAVEFLRKQVTKSKSIYGHNFVLSDINGKKITIDSFKGKVLFFDFWYTGCGACANFYKRTLAFAEEYFQQDSLIRFISVSVDLRKDHWLDGLKSEKYSSKKALNFYTSGKGIDSDFLKFYNIGEFPTVMLVDKGGVIRAFNNQDIYDKEKLIKLVEEFKN